MAAGVEELATLQEQACPDFTQGRGRFEAARRALRLRGPEWTALSVYAALVAFAIPYHEPWVDEAQSWQLARSLPLGSLFEKYIRYEGSPGLWHFLLWVLSRAHVGYAGMHWFCGAVGVAAVSVLLFRCPFPRYVKLVLPFTYFLLFQYAVIARSYVLVPILLFTLACGWRRSPVLVALLLGLLANVAVHAAAISAGLAVVYLLDRILRGDDRALFRRGEIIGAALILAGFFAFAAWTAWPPHDLLLHIAAVRGESRSLVEVAIASLVLGVCEPWPISIFFWVAIAFCLRSRRRLFFLLPVVLFAVLSGAVTASFWHAGLLVPLVITLLWIGWPGEEMAVGRADALAMAALLVMAGTQVAWSAYALAYDHSHAYSPDLAASRFLRPLVDEGARVAVTNLDEPQGIQDYRATGILPYFDHTIYMNQAEPFWWWSSENQTEERFAAALRLHPEIVIVEARAVSDGGPLPLETPKARGLIEAGYRMTNVFCGAMPQRFQLAGGSCHLIFRRAEGQSEAGLASSGRAER